jgi:hypothetical protein
MDSKPELLKTFFETQHQKWKGRAYTLIHFTCKNAPRISSYGKWMQSPKDKTPDPPSRPYHPKRD